MQLVITFLALGVFVMGIWWRQNQPTPTQNRISETPSISATPIVTPTASPTPEPAVSPEVTSAVPSVTTNPSNRYEQGWLYPGARLVSGEGSMYRLQTNDPPDAVYDWYENKFSALNLQVRNRIKAKANNTYNYRLNGASSDEEIDISITKNEGSDLTNIEMKFDGVQGML